MEFFASLQRQLDTLHQLLGSAPTTHSIPDRLHQLSDDDLELALATAASMERQTERLRLATGSVLAQRSNMRVHA